VWDDTRVYSVTGSLEGSYSGSYQITVGTAPRKYPRGDTFIASSSTEIYGAVSYSKPQQRKLLNKELLGETGSSPSWTHDNIGANQAFFAMPFSSSHHERDVLHLVESGSWVEQAVTVPLTASLFYRKPRSLVHRIYKLSASADLGTFVSTHGTLIPTGSTVSSPKTFNISVPDSGRLIDVKVWVEIVHGSASGAQPQLQTLGLSLRSPNSGWPNGNAHPLKNFVNGQATTDADLGGLTTMLLDNPHEPPQEFYKSSYILWEGPGLFALGVSLTGSALSEYRRSPTWNNDRHMRVVFSDASSVRNPRDLYKTYVTHEGVGPGSNTSGSPSGHASGNNAAWITDQNVESGGQGAAGSPPPGWLTGGGGVAAVNEFPTTGSNRGCTTIQPLYPLLETIVQKKEEQVIGVATGRSNFRKWISPPRPGLRGTEISGTWQLMVAVQPAHTATMAAASNAAAVLNDTFFRQWRLELIFEQNHGQVFTISPKRLRSGGVPFRKGLKVVSAISGTAFSNDPSDMVFGDKHMADYFLNTTHVEYGEELELGRTIGLISSSLELDVADFAVYTAAVSASFPSSSYDRSQILEILEPSNPLAGPKTLSSYVRSKSLTVTTRELARIQLSGSS
jgi:hypothetical protein